MSPEQREALGPPRRIPGGLVGRPYALDPEIARLIAEAERRGAEKALRKAADHIWEMVPSNLTAIYNEDVTAWLNRWADEIAGAGS